MSNNNRFAEFFLDYTSGKNLTIPDDAKEVFSGKYFRIFHYKRVFNGIEFLMEKAVYNSSVQIIAVKDGKVVILFEKQPGNEQGYYSLPGGGVEPGDNSIVTAQKELAQEAALASEEIYLLFVGYLYGNKIEATKTIYVAQGCKTYNGPEKQDLGEQIEVLYVDFDVFIELVRKNQFRDSAISIWLNAILAKDGYENSAQNLEKLKKLILG